MVERERAEKEAAEAAEGKTHEEKPRQVHVTEDGRVVPVLENMYDESDPHRGEEQLDIRDLPAGGHWTDGYDLFGAAIAFIRTAAKQARDAHHEEMLLFMKENTDRQKYTLDRMVEMAEVRSMVHVRMCTMPCLMLGCTCECLWLCAAHVLMSRLLQLGCMITCDPCVRMCRRRIVKPKNSSVNKHKHVVSLCHQLMRHVSHHLPRDVHLHLHRRHPNRAKRAHHLPALNQHPAPALPAQAQAQALAQAPA